VPAAWGERAHAAAAARDVPAFLALLACDAV
jgi:hypothetical protein